MGCPIKGSCNAFECCPPGTEKYNLARFFCDTSDSWQTCPQYRSNSSNGGYSSRSSGGNYSSGSSGNSYSYRSTNLDISSKLKQCLEKEDEKRVIGVLLSGFSIIRPKQLKKQQKIIETLAVIGCVIGFVFGLIIRDVFIGIGIGLLIGLALFSLWTVLMDMGYCKENSNYCICAHWRRHK